MATRAEDRGEALVAGGRAVKMGPRWLARAFAGSGGAILDRIDRGLAAGRIDGILPDGTRRTLGGRAPGFVAEVELKDWRALLRVATSGSVGLFQGWDKGEWSSPDPVQLFALFMANAATLGDLARARGPWRWLASRLHKARANSRAGAARNIHRHYDLGNDFYAAWLDPAMVYSSARFDLGPDSLAAAQDDKLRAIASRVEGAKTVLEIGCGWGALAARLRGGGAAVTAISLSEAQLAYARAAHDGIDFRHQDYRDVAGTFDAIVSVEMVEALGREYWPAFIETLARNLGPGGRAALQFITLRDDLYDAYAASADFIQAYVFPGGMLLRLSEFRRLAEAHGFAWENQIDFGPDYAETLRLWRDNFDAAVRDNRLPPGFDDRFVKLWRYYLMYCEGGFRGGGIDVHQVTLVR